MRYINIIGQIDDKLIKDVLEQLYKIEKEDNDIINNNSKLIDKKDYKEIEDLTINITTNGGYCYGFYAIWDIIKKLKCKIITRAYGQCESCGIFLFLMGEERYAGEFTEFLHHKMSYSYPYSKLQEHVNIAEYRVKQDKREDEYIISRTNITKDMLDKYKLADWWFDYEEAVKLGVVNKSN
ncbi:ATP-dependent Clp protease proteolytic subunit [Clostridium botulinum]|uniref:ATP-dependent Clp protease proteolytic subunit n=1 Tax=Clostridium botulinum TaxID=1491 RepID=UPI001C9A84D8|nr:ATP-dependent Clp protease proteolytic subunit [Clostridium botulinum]MBY6838693.1 ATP-dependent Clp protease proteolytic subunit [Clostridium botulinum]